MAKLALINREAKRAAMADIESQAGALPEVVGLFKTFEDGFRVFRGNAGTGIGDGEGDVSGMLCEGVKTAENQCFFEIYG